MCNFLTKKKNLELAMEMKKINKNMKKIVADMNFNIAVSAKI